MASNKIIGGTVHGMTPDLAKALDRSPKAKAAWLSLTPLARNEWICWVISVKQSKTREDHVTRTIHELQDGVRRPCCWMGCVHRTDKQISPSVQAILDKRSKIK